MDWLLDDPGEEVGGDPVDNDVPENRHLQIHKLPGEDEKEALARTVLRPDVQASLTIAQMCNGAFADVGITELTNALEKYTKQAKDGDLERADDILVAQAHTLDALFHQLVRRSIMNMGEYMEAAEKYMKLALRAQSQCKGTLEALAELKKPPFIKQTNIAHGPQQVNIHTPKNKEQLAKNQKPPNELLEKKEHEPDKRLDGGTPKEAVGVDQEMEAVGEIDRAKDA